MRLFLLCLIALLLVAACVRRQDTVPCNHENDRAAWAQSNLSASAYDSLMIAQGKRCTAP